MKTTGLTRLATHALVLAAFTGCDRKTLLDQHHAQEASGGLRADYYQYSDTDTFFFRNKKLSRVDREINNYFKNDSDPAPGMDLDNHAIRWYGNLVPPKTARYTLCTCTDDGVNLVFNGEQKFKFWTGQRRFWGTTVEVEAGKRYPLMIEYFNSGSEAVSRLYWAENPGNAPWEDVCRNFTPQAPTETSPPPPYDCDPEDDVINPALQIVSGAYLEPGTDEVGALLSSCQPPPPSLNTAQAPDATSPNTLRARKLFQRLGGQDVPIFDSRIAYVKSLLDQGKPKEAARFVSANSAFYDRTVRSFAARVSTRAERPDVPLNDFIATVVGVTRDQIDARKLLTGGFLYRANPKMFWGDRSAYETDQLLMSNEHYDLIDQMRAPLACALDKLDPYNLVSVPEHMQQRLRDPAGNERPNPDPAGVLTSRAFAEAHMIAGTNRRPVQKAFEYFACAPIDSWRDAEISDQYIGRDVERFPNGPTSFNEFLSSCKTCHGPMDAMRGAFSQFHFENGYLKFAPFFVERQAYETVGNAAEQRDRMKLTAPCQEINTTCNPNSGTPRLAVHWKLNHNVNYRDGNFVKDNSFTNLLTSSRHALRFGWSGQTSGHGIREFGRMIANSRAFPVCMAQRAYAEVCKDDPFRADFPSELTQWLEQVGEGFAGTGYNLKDLFETVAVNCLD
jgi:hypothetical protein